MLCTRLPLHQTDSGWVDRDVTNDTALDSQPALGRDGSGRLVAVWSRIAAAGAGEQPGQRIPQAEIAVSVFDQGTGSWSTPSPVTTNSCADLSPRLTQGQDGSLYLTWLQSPDNLLPIDFNRPGLPHTDIWIARWSGTGFTEAVKVADRADTLEAPSLCRGKRGQGSGVES